MASEPPSDDEGPITVIRWERLDTILSVIYNAVKLLILVLILLIGMFSIVYILIFNGHLPLP